MRVFVRIDTPLSIGYAALDLHGRWLVVDSLSRSDQGATARLLACNL